MSREHSRISTRSRFLLPHTTTDEENEATQGTMSSKDEHHTTDKEVKLPQGQIDATSSSMNPWTWIRQVRHLFDTKAVQVKPVPAKISPWLYLTDERFVRPHKPNVARTALRMSCPSIGWMTVRWRHCNKTCKRQVLITPNVPDSTRTITT